MHPGTTDKKIKTSIDLEMLRSFSWLWAWFQSLHPNRVPLPSSQRPVPRSEWNTLLLNLGASKGPVGRAYSNLSKWPDTALLQHHTTGLRIPHLRAFPSTQNPGTSTHLSDGLGFRQATSPRWSQSLSGWSRTGPQCGRARLLKQTSSEEGAFRRVTDCHRLRTLVTISHVLTIQQTHQNL